MSLRKIEIIAHVIFWIFYFSSINVAWSSDWFDVSIRPKIPAPLSVLIFPIFFYVNAYILIPRYFSFEKWKSYVLFAILLFIFPELIRSGIHCYNHPTTSFETAIFSRDSFLFGAPSPFFIALNSSFIYRLTMDYFANKRKIKQLETKQPKESYENMVLLTKEEGSDMRKTLDRLMLEDEVYLQTDITLRQLAEQMNTSEKKLSYLLNQDMNTNFYEMLNTHRVERFKLEADKPENESLSIVGVADNCGFSSKSSFYRAFKAITGSSPSVYMKNRNNPSNT